MSKEVIFLISLASETFLQRKSHVDFLTCKTDKIGSLHLNCIGDALSPIITGSPNASGRVEECCSKSQEKGSSNPWLCELWDPRGDLRKTAPIRELGFLVSNLETLKAVPYSWVSG